MIEIILVGLSLSFDSFAASVICGYCISHKKMYSSSVIAFTMGLFQGGMLFLGWLGGSFTEKFIEIYDHWIAFALLSIISGKIILESRKKKENNIIFNPLKPLILSGLALATSIDAFVVGITFAFINHNIIIASTTVGLITFISSFLGVWFSIKIKDKINFNFEIIGALILFGLGIKILISHLYF